MGFRPFVYHLASRLQLGGAVTNHGGSVQIEVEGDSQRLDEFLSDLVANRPPRSRIKEVTWKREPLRGDNQFQIHPSLSNPQDQVTVSPDIATCDRCIDELFDPFNRRYHYPFLNCTDCGPRLTIITGSPYDRPETTMASFIMCAECQAEYDNVADRRFHAQPTACARCGPRLSFHDCKGQEAPTGNPLHRFLDALRDHRIGAMKGLGGYHLVCDATSESAVVELRRRKHRHEKPFAVMVADVAAAAELCDMSVAERTLLCSPERPIVLLKKRHRTPLAASVILGNPLIGVMLPYTPLHHLLLRQMNSALVMTSGNRADEPIATSEPEVFARLAGIADVFLTHNRPIHVRCDDSVTRMIDQTESPVRRSRGYAPRTLQMRCNSPATILATGAQLKNTFCIGTGGQALVSHHLGDLDNFESYRAFERDIALYEKLFAVRPQYIVHDLHPDYASTRYAKRRAAAERIPVIPVQHHHAHMASCMVENNITETAIGVCFDGTGYGTDNTLWGGEFLIGDYRSFKRAAHFRKIPMPGGDKAILEPWRMAWAYLADAKEEWAPLRKRIGAVATRAADQMLAHRFNCPLTSSAGRCFDAIASLIGLRDRVTYEGQAAIELEWLAGTVETDEAFPFAFAEDAGQPTEIDFRPAIHGIVSSLHAATPPAVIARRFHNTLADVIVQTCQRMIAQGGVQKVVLTGGVFMNALLLSATRARLKQNNISAFTHHVVPPNDGGVSLGQLAVAAAQIGERPCV